MWASWWVYRATEIRDLLLVVHEPLSRPHVMRAAGWVSSVLPSLVDEPQKSGSGACPVPFLAFHLLSTQVKPGF